MPPVITVSREGGRWSSRLPEAEKLAEQAVRLVLRAEGWGRRAVAVDVTLSTDARVQELNRDWRGKDRPTNVLSFPLESPSTPIPRGRPRQLGDIILACETLMREAAEQGKSPAHHFFHLVVHGTLHLLGYDHETEEEAEQMEVRETTLLKRCGIPDPYGV